MKDLQRFYIKLVVYSTQFMVRFSHYHYCRRFFFSCSPIRQLLIFLFYNLVFAIFVQVSVRIPFFPRGDKVKIKSRKCVRNADRRRRSEIDVSTTFLLQRVERISKGNKPFKRYSGFSRKKRERTCPPIKCLNDLCVTS